MRTKTVYLAFDDTEFDSTEACKAYEAAHSESRLVGLNLEQIHAAIARTDVDLADAFEKIGSRIAKARLDAGDLRRGKKVVAEPETPRQADPIAPDPAAKMQEALDRARTAGRAAWDRREGAVVPGLFAGAKPLHDAWLDGWEQGQAEYGQVTAAEPVAEAVG